MRAEGGGEAGFPSPPLTCEPFPATVGGGHMQEVSSSGSPDHHLATLLLLLPCHLRVYISRSLAAFS